MPQIDIRLKSTADNSGFDSASNASKSLGKSMDSAAAGARGMAGGLGEAEIKAAAGKDVIEGLSAASKGGEGAFFGLSKAAGAFFSILNASPVMVLVSAVGLLLAGIKLLTGKIIESSNAWEEHDKKIKPISEEYKKIGDASKSSLDEQLKRIEKLTNAYDDFTKAAARSRKEVEQMNSAQQKLDIARIDKEEASVLRTAKTEKERDEIKQKYDDKRLKVRNKYEDIASENERLSAQLQIRESEEQIRKVQTERDRVDSALRDKQAEFESALSKSRTLLESGASPTEVSASVRESLLAKRARDEAVKAKADFEEKSRAQEEKAYEDARAARAALSVSGIESKTREVERQIKPEKYTAEDRKKAQDELNKLKSETESAAQQRMAAGVAYEYTDAERAAIAEKQKALDKMGPTKPAAPTAPAKPVKTTTYAPRTAAEKAGQTPGANEPASAGQPDQLPDLATPIKDATKAVESAAPALAEQLQPAVDATKDFAAKVPELKLDGAPLAAGIQASTTAITALQQANTSVLTDVLSLVKEQNTTIKTLATQTNSLRVEVGQLRAQVRNAA